MMISGSLWALQIRLPAQYYYFCVYYYYYELQDSELGEVYYYCLMAFFRVLGPEFDEETDKKFYAILRENQLKGKNR